MSLSLLTPSRTILMISDDALFIYSISSKGVKMVEVVPWTAENFEEDVALIITKECGGKPVLILNDMVEQHYRKEKVPRVSVMDKSSILKRKLNVAFPNYPVRAALPLKEKVAKTDRTMAGSVYIFAAIPATDAFKKTMAAATRSLVPIAGFALLPIESSDMIKKLSEKTVAKGEKTPRWTIFMGQHQGGGLRQIVIKDGELALTRMTPIVDCEAEPDLWATEVNQEFQATMSYLSRFGFDPDDGLNVILVSEPSAGDAVGNLLDVPCSFRSMSADEVAKLMSLNMGDQDNYYLSDALHVAWIGKKSKFILPMKARQIDNVSQPRQLAAMAMVIMLLFGAFQTYQLLDSYQKLAENSGRLVDMTQRTSQLSLQYKKEVKRKKDLGFDIQLIQSSLAVFDKLEEKQIKAIGLFFNIGRALGKDMRIDRITVTRGKLGLADKMLNKNAKSPLFTSGMQMSFPSNTDAEKGNKEVKGLRARIQSLLPGHTVKVSKLLEDYEYNEEIVVETGDDNSKSTKQDFVAEITIEGPAVK